tara:strand:- start:494 stop:937 length:444 start_codon:yes stop_codon:yes gene_type:complete
MKSIVRIYFTLKIKDADLSEAKNNLLDKGYDEKQIPVVLEHLKAYLAGVRAGYRLMPSKEIVDATSGISFDGSEVIEDFFYNEVQSISDCYVRYSTADITFYRNVVRKTGSYLRKFGLKIKTGKGTIIYGRNSSSGISYQEDIFVSF